MSTITVNLAADGQPGPDRPSSRALLAEIARANALLRVRALRFDATTTPTTARLDLLKQAGRELWALLRTTTIYQPADATGVVQVPVGGNLLAVSESAWAALLERFQDLADQWGSALADDQDARDQAVAAAIAALPPDTRKATA